MAANKRRSSKGGGGGSSSGSSSSKASTTSSSSSDNNGSKKKNSSNSSSSSNNNSFFAWGKRKRHYHHDKKLGHLTTSTIQAAGVLVLAIITALVWNNSYYNNNADPADPVIAAFLNKFCNINAAESNNNNNNMTTPPTTTSTTTFCHSFLVPTTRGRTLQAIRDIFPQQRVVQIPRSLMIFDLDALRNPWIRREFFEKPQLRVLLSALSSSSSSSQQQQQDPSSTSPSPLSSLVDADAFLAVHLALLQQQESDDDDACDESISHSSSASASSSSSSMHHPLLLDYVRNVMPSYQHFEEHHPLLWPDATVRELFGGVYTSTYQVVRLFRQSIKNEYQILSSASTAFARKVSWEHYVRARLCVMTRSFGTGPLLQSKEQEQEEEANDDGTAAARMTLAEEFALYREKLGLHVEHGSHALVPVLDLLNHHATPNVGYVYDTVKRAFVITSLGNTIPAGHDVFDSYGKHTDVHLFARYGFVSADGSEHSQSNLAIWHDVYEADVDRISNNYMNPDRVVARSRRMLRYLQFDDGYHECITANNNSSSHHDAYRLKMLKFIKLSQMAHTPSSFAFILGPRNKHATTPSSSSSSSHSIISMSDLTDHKPGDAPFDGNAIFATCRLLVLTHRDYNGSATQMLKHNLYNDTYALPNLMSTRDALEFRTILCVTRLAREALRRFNVTVQQQKEMVVSLSSKTAKHVGSRAWMAAHLRLSEMQNLEFLIKVAFGGLQNFPHSNDMNLLNSEEDYWMRHEPCPAEIAIDPYMQHLKPPPTVIGGGDSDDDDEKPKEFG